MSPWPAWSSRASRAVARPGRSSTVCCPPSPAIRPRGCLSDHRIVGPIVGDGEISDAAWAVMGPLLPPAGRARARGRDHRQVLEGIVFKFRTGLPWRDLPERFGPWQTVHGRFARWAADHPRGGLVQDAARQFPAACEKVASKTARHIHA
ncbi:transposase [Streptomyces drozdowiczii]|uniref:transposase n=1 Tax=Streptomyces drozdowiczii TaxID=202862 RepID=UPI00403CE319